MDLYYSRKFSTIYVIHMQKSGCFKNFVLNVLVEIITVQVSMPLAVLAEKDLCKASP